jgi:hypothetical protein
MKVLELKGYKSYRALTAFHTLMLGLKMLPAYMTEDYEAFYARVSLMPPRDQEKLIREAALLVELKQEEVEAFACFAADPNGIPYDASNLKNLGPREIHEIIVAVCVEISKIKVDLISDGEKKN